MIMLRHLPDRLRCTPPTIRSLNWREIVVCIVRACCASAKRCRVPVYLCSRPSYAGSPNKIVVFHYGYFRIGLVSREANFMRMSCQLPDRPVGELPSHLHVLAQRESPLDRDPSTGGAYTFNADTGYCSRVSKTGCDYGNRTTPVGNNSPHNNLSPCKAAYAWKRTA